MKKQSQAQRDAELGKAYGVSPETTRKWRAQGAPVDDPAALSDWLAKLRTTPKQSPDGTTGPLATIQEAKLAQVQEAVREKRRKNDVAEGKLVSRAWLVSAIGSAAGELNSLRAKSEAEDPLRLAAAGADVPANRAELKRVWDGVIAAIRSLATHFKEDKAT